MPYGIHMDGIFSSVELTDEEPDGDYTFATFGEAKRQVLRNLRLQRDELNYTIKHLAAQRKDEVERRWET